MDQHNTAGRIEYHKLIRDRIPEIIQQDGKTYEIVRLSEEEYPKALREKLIEEAREAAAAPVEGLQMEIADLYEVLDTLMKLYNIDGKTVREVQQQRYLKRGGFEQRLQLLWSEE